MNTIKPTIARISLVTGLLLGSFALSVLAQAWGPAGCAAPGCNTDKPIDVGTTAQFRRGPLAVATTSVPTAGFAFEAGGSGWFTGLLVTGLTNTNTLKVTGTDSDKVGYVLKNDGAGDAVWTDPATISGLGTGSNVHYINPVCVFAITTETPYRDVNCSTQMPTHAASKPPTEWTDINYGTLIPTSVIPTTAKTLIVRAYAQANQWNVYVYMKDDTSSTLFPAQIVAHAYGPNNSDDAASDSAIFNIPYGSGTEDKTFQASWYANLATEGGRAQNESGGQRAEVYIIGYTD